MSAGALKDRVRIDKPVMTDDGKGGQTRTWAEELTCWSAWIYSRGSEAVDAARLQGRAVYKVKLRSSPDARKVTTEHSLVDLRDAGIRWQIREVDALTDRAWVYLVVERGVAV